MKRLTVFVLFIVVNTTCFLYGQAEDYNNLLQKAKQGDGGAQFEIAERHYLGEYGVEKNLEQAFKWYEKAAESGDVDAERKVAIMYAKGEGVEANQKEALNWYEKAAENGDATSQYLVGNFYYYGKNGVEKNQEKALNWYKKAAENGNTSAKEALVKINQSSKIQ